MKNTLKLLFIVAFLAIIGLTFIACEQEKSKCNCSVYVNPEGTAVLSSMTSCQETNCIINMIRISPYHLTHYANQTVTCNEHCSACN